MQKPSANLVLLYIIGCNIMSFLTLLSTWKLQKLWEMSSSTWIKENHLSFI